MFLKRVYKKPSLLLPVFLSTRLSLSPQYLFFYFTTIICWSLVSCCNYFLSFKCCILRIWNLACRSTICCTCQKPISIVISDFALCSTLVFQLRDSALTSSNWIIRYLMLRSCLLISC